MMTYVFGRFMAVMVMLLPSLLLAQNLNFRIDALTHLNTVSDMWIESDGTLVAGTTGGLLLHDLNEGSAEIFTSADGLFDHELTAITQDKRNTLIAGSFSGTLTFFDREDGSIQNDANLSGNPVTDLQVVEDTLWVLTETFVSVYLYEQDLGRYQFRESYAEFGAEVTPLHSIALSDNNVWIAGEAGLVSGSSDFQRVNLYVSTNWTVQTADDGLPTSRILDLLVDPETGNLLLGTANGLSVYDYQSFQNNQVGLVDRQLYHLAIHDGTLYVTTDDYIYRLDGETFTQLAILEHTDITSVIVHPETDELWYATYQRGLFNLDSGARLYFDSPLDNYIGEITVDSKGNLWCTTGLPKDERKLGLWVLTESGWKNYVFFGGDGDNYRFANSSLTVFEDDAGNVWVGAWGGAVTVFDPDLNPTGINRIEGSGSVWVSSSTEDDTLEVESVPEWLDVIANTGGSNDDYAVITDIIKDEVNSSILLLNHAASTGRGILQYKGLSFDERADWVSHLNPFGDNDWWELTQDIFGDIWLLAAGGSRAVVQTRLDDTGFYIVREFTQNADNVKSNVVQSIAADFDGYLWVGTTSGLSGILDGTVFDFRENYQPIGLKINDIYVDSQNNKWFATDKGLSILLATGSPFEPASWVHIIPENSSLDPSQLFTWPHVFRSNLPTETLHSVVLDENSGDVYLGTPSGIGVIRSNPIASAFTTYDAIKAGPNPLILDDQQYNTFNIYNLTLRSEVRILAANGQLVRTLSPGNFSEVQGSGAQWDGRNMEGRLVSTGVYVYLVTNENGEQASGKVLVINR